MKKIVALLLFVCAMSASAHEIVWHKSVVREPAPIPAFVVEVDTFPDECFRNRVPFVAAMPQPMGCYIPWKRVFGVAIPGSILIAKRLAPWTRECVERHERRHDEGEDHDEGWGDCP